MSLSTAYVHIQGTRHSHQNTRIQAEVKILIVLCYLIVSVALTGTSDAFTMARREVHAQSIADYLLCESTGVRAGQECDRGEFEKVDLVVLMSVSLTLLGFVPAVILTYVVNVAELKKKWTMCSLWFSLKCLKLLVAE